MTDDPRSSAVPATPGSQQPAARGARAALVVLLLVSTLSVMAGAVLSPVVELIRTELTLSGTAAGLVLTAHGLSLAVISPLIGRAIDRWGVRTPLAAGLVLYGLAGGAGLVIDSYPALLVSRLAFGIGAAAVFTGSTVALFTLRTGASQDRVMGWRSTAISLGGVTWPLLGGTLGGISWHAPFGVYLVGVPLGLAVLRLLPSDEPAHRPSDQPAAPGRFATTARSGGLRGLVRQRPALLGIYGLQAVATAMLYGVTIFLPLRLAQVGVTDTFVVAVFTVSLSLVMSAVGLYYARARAKLGYHRLLLLAFSSWVVALVILGVADEPVLLLVAPAVFGIGMGLAVPALTMLVGGLAPAGSRGQATALLATATFSGQFVSPLILGPVEQATSVQGAFLAAAGFAGATLGLIAAFGRRLEHPTEHPRT